MTPHESCIALNLIPGIGFVRYTALLEYFGSVDAVFGASAEELRQVPGFGEQLAERVAAFARASTRASLDGNGVEVAPQSERVVGRNEREFFFEEEQDDSGVGE